MIAGSRVVLRERRPSDVPYAQAWLDDVDAMRWTLHPYPAAPDAYDVPGEPLSWGLVPLTVVDAESGRPIGHAGLGDMVPEHRRALCWIVIGDAAFRGRGYGEDTMRTLCRFAFETVNLAKVELEVVADNAAAVRLYERIGFVREVTRRRARWIEGAWHDEHLMGLFPEELR
ncbi:MAG TPA: GNAT family protein [Frankiaceae bacterium]|nr:GNAT family protein [Frankiaceae bacterium]